MRDGRRAVGVPLQSLLSGLLSVFLCSSISASPLRDSTSVRKSIKWSLSYTNRIELERSSEPFPWNDRESESHVNDRLVLMAELAPSSSFGVFLKGATGRRGAGRNIYRSRFSLEQGHAGFSLLRGTLRGRLFLRERVYRTDHRLLRLVSNDSPFIRDRGEGLKIEIGRGSRFSMSYTESILRDGSFDGTGGLPEFSGGGDVFRLLRGNVEAVRGFRIGTVVSETRSIQSGDAVMVGMDIGLSLRGVDLVAELARTCKGRWKDLNRSSLFDVRPGNLRLGESGSVFSENVAFSTEIHGMELKTGNLGTFAVVPGYRFHGNEFEDPHGEVGTGLVESYITSWWRHPRYDAILALNAAECYRNVTGEDFGLLDGSLRLRYRGGFEVSERILLREGEKPSFVLSILDENSVTRTSATARIDDAGGENHLSFLVEGGMNIGRAWTLRSLLYLYRETRSFYNMELEFRPGSRFLLKAALGSLSPFDEGMGRSDRFMAAYGNITYRNELMNQGMYLDPPSGERWISVYTRIWFGRMRDP